MSSGKKTMKRSMSETRDLLARVVSVKPDIKVEDTRMDGDVIFSVKLADLGMMHSDFSSQIMRTRFFINFVGELLVRENIEIFVETLQGLDEKMYEDMVCCQQHTDFGMVIDHDEGLLRFTMHLSLADSIYRERFDSEDGGLFGLGHVDDLDDLEDE